MVTPGRAFAVGFVVATLALFGAAAPALALGGTTGSDSTTTSSSSSSGSDTSSSQTSGGDGGPVHGQRRSCSLYATSSSYGLSCISGGSGDAPKVKDLLGNSPAPTCWDTPVSPGDARDQYGETVPDDRDYDYFVLSCITGLDLNAPLFDQPGLNLSQKLVEIKMGAPACPDPKTTPFSPAQLTGDDTHCLLELIGNQSKVTGFLASDNAQIPDVTIVTHPSTVVRTQVDTVFTDAADCNDCSDNGTKTAPKSAGGVTMYAQLDSFRILPYGPYSNDPTDGKDAVGPCAGTADWTAKDACHYTYPRSSADQPGHAYPFRAVATWSVRIEGEDAPFATFHKYDDLKLPVGDVQTLVIPGTN
jgi:hypothetical protein